MTAVRRRHGKPEAIEQTNICNLTRSLGGRCWVLGTKRKRGDHQGTMQTPGLADLWLWLPARGDQPALALWWECKAPKGGGRSQEQVVFGDACQQANIPYGWGALDNYIQWLMVHGRLRPENIGAHHLSGEK